MIEKSSIHKNGYESTNVQGTGQFISILTRYATQCGAQKSQLSHTMRDADLQFPEDTKPNTSIRILWASESFAFEFS